MNRILLITYILSSFVSVTLAQRTVDRFEILEEELASYAVSEPKIDRVIDISITGTINEFALAFSRETKINLTVDPNIKEKIVTNFSETKPRDILLHLCKFYNLDLSFSGSIIGLIKFEEPTMPEKLKPVGVSYNDYSKKLELDLKSDTLDVVLKRISELTGINVISTRAASNTKVSGFIGGTDFEKCMAQLATRNNLSIEKKDEQYFLVDIAKRDANDVAATTQPEPKKGRKSSRNSKKQKVSHSNDGDGSFEITFSEASKTIDVISDQATLGDLISTAANKSGENFFLFDELSEKIDLQIKDAPFEQFLIDALMGTPYAFKKEDGIYLIGKTDKVGLLETKVYQLEHRTVKDLAEAIPEDLKNSVAISEFLQLNALVLSGTKQGIEKATEFIQEIDRSVPVIMIELLIVDVTKNHEIRAGVEAGVSTAPVPAGGSVFPGVDFTFSSGAINDLLSTLSGNGIVNLGKVNPNFYARLQAVEDNGFAKVRSKPRLSTLNGVEANLTLGETRYYLNERTTLQGNQNPISLQDRQFEAVNADFSIRIVPIVSGDEYVTLEIEVNQSDFIGQVQNNAPPPQVNRTFTSNIRIHNQEMIVLGGLESKGVEGSGTGVPFLSRIPVIKWLFSKRRRATNKSKLLVFVKPTVIY